MSLLLRLAAAAMAFVLVSTQVPTPIFAQTPATPTVSTIHKESGTVRPPPAGPAVGGAQIPRAPSVSDARTGTPMRFAATPASAARSTASATRRAMDVTPPSSAGCSALGGDTWSCNALPGMSYDLPVTSQVPPDNDPTHTCFNAYPIYYWVSNPPRGVSVTLLNWSGSSDCGSIINGTVRVSFSAEAAWGSNDAPDFTFKLAFSECGAFRPRDCVYDISNGFGPTGGTRYGFFTPLSPRAPAPAIPERACGRCNGTTIGMPIDVATGELWNEKTDLALSGPFGLSFTRFYGSQTAGSADLGGTNWRHPYAVDLDVSNAGNGKVTYYDTEGMPYYFTGVTAGGAAAYDGIRGSQLALLSDRSTYTLTEFDGHSWTFNANGQLTMLHDRAQNVQTVMRDATTGHANRIASVSDTLGRQLCFYYDTANRIVAVAAEMNAAACPATAPASTVSAPVVTLAYNTGTNCSANSLCAVTEPDGAKWTYQYSTSDPAYPYNLSMVLDPLGDPEEINTFSGNKVVHQESGLCSTSPCAETGNYVNIAYPSAGSSTATLTDGLGRPTTLTYDPNSLLLTRISGPLCRCGGDQTRAYTYDASGRVVTASDDGIDGSAQHTMTYVYNRPDANGKIYPGPTSITEKLTASGTTRTTSMLYYGVGDPRQDLPQTITRPSVDQPGLSVTTSNTYSLAGLLTQRTKTGYVNGGQTTYTWRWTYDGRGRLLTETSPRTDVNATTTYTYFPDAPASASAGQVQSVTDALGHAVQFSAVGGFNSFTPFGDPQSMVDPNGVTNEYTFDARGRVLTETLLATADGEPTAVTQSVYDAAGRRIRTFLPAGNGTYFNYDTSDRLKEVKRVDSSLLKHDRLLLTYDAFDAATNITAQVCPSPTSGGCAGWTNTFSLGYVYSPTTSDLTQVVNADNTSKRYAYTAAGGVAALNDENHTTGNNFTYAYDLAGRKLSETRAMPGGAVTTQYAYDLHDNVTSTTDANGNVTTYHYDDFDRVTVETSRVTGVKTYAYDADDNITSMFNANGTSAAYTYDALSRTLTETDTKGTATANEAWTYDDPTSGHYGIGRLATMTDPSGSTAYTYDRLGMVTVENHNVAGSVFTYGYSYDVNGNRTTLAYPDGTIVSYTFDFADRPYSASQVQPGSQLSLTRQVQSVSPARLRARGLAAPIHPAKSELPLHTSGHGPTIVNLPQRRAVSPIRRAAPGPATDHITTTAGASARRAPSSRADSVLVASTTYAPFGPMTSMAFGNGTTQTMSYNQRYLLQENKLVANGTALADHVYAEDAVGNVTSVTDALDAGYSRTFGYDDLNRIATANSGSKLWGSVSGNGYNYDNMGNVRGARLGTTSRSFTYKPGASGSSGLPLLASVIENGGTARNIAYDAAGSELSDGVNTFAYGARELLGSALPNVQTYAYDGLRRRVESQTATGMQRTSLYDGENHLLAESDLSTSTPSTIAYDYVWFGDRPVAQLDAVGTHWTHADHLGTPIVQTDASGAVSWQAEHEPFGKVWSLRSGDVHQPLRLPGQVSDQFDAGANGVGELSYNNARWYRPAWGRYTQIDPIPTREATDPYAYALDNPTTADDPSGMDPGPYHPPAGVKMRCRETDSCAVLEGKIWLFERTIHSHEGWDRNVARPNGGNRHSAEIADLYGGYAKCIAIYAAKCLRKKPGPSQPGASCPALDDSALKAASNAAAAAAAAVILYWVISEGTRLFPPRNLLPIP